MVYTVAQSCPTFCSCMDCSRPGSPFYVIFQARILEYVTISSSRGSLLDPGIKSTFPAASASAGRFLTTEQAYRGFPGGSDGQESACNAGDPGSIPASGRCHGEGNSNPPPVFLHGKSHGQRSLAGHSSWGCKELGMIDQLTISVSGLQ